MGNQPALPVAALYGSPSTLVLANLARGVIRLVYYGETDRPPLQKIDANSFCRVEQSRDISNHLQGKRFLLRK